ncbi:SDR family oxidoreductase [Bradyrhizobium diazoefficiens]|uniref:SDR family NAD(P)-dependent oxidoreductase n=1 Tax=Bradyrhizobium diazoefficiens TaxID=1355477 RepID=UPI001B8D3BB7|nr:SDR family oxidoreductase [Bradyrhizobium diazoefficiens]MBR0863510.1 SDR family oxidoreductase [Bradyrhizobium diazoefficiens]MBR0888195.1 SDR family oxidoreductase [Bradyrhizobium diazoefficiens]MBR0919836.1 SDR family oxidoreductase [Bradyrhizobium diazoefficiens]
MADGGGRGSQDAWSDRYPGQCCGHRRRRHWWGGLNTSYEAWRKVISINLDGTFLGCKTVMPSMIENGEGSVINISSIVSFMGTATLIAYGASKAGVEQMTRSLAILGAAGGKRVRCNSVHPGIIKTRMTDTIFAEFATNTGKTDAEVEQMLCSSVLLGKRGVPEDVAEMILYLASDESRYVTGSAFRVDGGWSVTSAG